MRLTPNILSIHMHPFDRRPSVHEPFDVYYTFHMHNRVFYEYGTAHIAASWNTRILFHICRSRTLAL